MNTAASQQQSSIVMDQSSISNHEADISPSYLPQEFYRSLEIKTEPGTVTATPCSSGYHSASFSISSKEKPLSPLRMQPMHSSSCSQRTTSMSSGKMKSTAVSTRPSTTSLPQSFTADCNQRSVKHTALLHPCDQTTMSPPLLKVKPSTPTAHQVSLTSIQMHSSHATRRYSSPTEMSPPPSLASPCASSMSSCGEIKVESGTTPPWHEHLSHSPQVTGRSASVTPPHSGTTPSPGSDDAIPSSSTNHQRVQGPKMLHSAAAGEFCDCKLVLQFIVFDNI